MERRSLPLTKLKHGMLAPSETQVENIRRANAARTWGFAAKDFKALGQVPAWWEEDPYEPLVLVPYLGTAATTLRELWDVIVGTYPRTSLDPRIIFDDAHVRYAEDVGGPRHHMAPAPHTLQWEVLSWRGTVRPTHPRPYAHAGVLALFAHHPEWVARNEELARMEPYGFAVRPKGAPKFALGDCRSYSLTLALERDASGPFVHLGIRPTPPSDPSSTILLIVQSASSRE